MYPLAILTPNGKVFEGEVDLLTAPGAEGEFSVMSHHMPLVTTLPQGALKIKQGDQERFFALLSGILEVNGSGAVLILADYIEETKNIAEAKVKSKDLGASLSSK